MEANSPFVSAHTPERTWRRYTKFLLVGGANAVVDLVVLNALLLVAPTQSAWRLSLYNTLAVSCAIINSYVWNHKWTFADSSDGSSRERVAFLLQALVNIILNDIIMVWLSTYLTLVRSMPLIISSNLGKGLAMFLSSMISYLAMRLFVFRSVRQVRDAS